MPAGPAPRRCRRSSTSGAPWELGLAEVHQVLLRNGLRDRVALRTDGGLQTGRDLLIAALLGAEEFAFGTGALVAVGCDMARQCHLDTCPTGIATQREDLRAKFTGTPEMAERYFLALAEDLRRELASVGARSLGIDRRREPAAAPARPPAARAELEPVIGAAPWDAEPARRDDPALPARTGQHAPASPLEVRVASAFRDQGPISATGLRLSTADRSFGAGLTGALERGELRGPIRLELRGSAGQSFGAFTGAGVELRLVGQANDYVGKGLSGGRVTIAPEPDLAVPAAGEAIAGNTVLYGATGGRLAPRRSGRHALRRPQLRRPGRRRGHRPAWLRVHDRRRRRRARTGRGQLRCRHDRWPGVPVRPERPAHRGARRRAMSRPTRLAIAAASAHDGAERMAELVGLLQDHRDAGSAPATRLLDAGDIGDVFWVVEPIVGRGPGRGRGPGSGRAGA